MKHNCYQHIKENIYRENRGLSFDEMIEGITIEHQPGRTITASDNIWSSLISMNQHPLHIDAKYGESTRFSKSLVSSLVTFNIINGMTVNSISYNAIANLGWEHVKLISPVFVGDTLYAKTKIINKRFSKKDPKNAIVKTYTTGHNQNGIEIINFYRNILMPTNND